MEDLSRYYTLLRDPARRRIVEILGAQEKIGFKDLRETLGLGVGTVYYHLDMLSDFLSQDKQRKYRLNDRGKTLYRILKEGNVPADLEIGEALSHKIGKWLFLSPLFAKTTKLQVFLPVSLAVLCFGALGSALAQLDPALFFYFPYSVYSQAGIAALYLLNWMGLFILVELLSSLLYRRAGNELQLFACLGLATFPLAVFPYIYRLVSDAVTQYALFPLQIWSLLLVSAAVCFGKDLRLDKAFALSLTAMYLNISLLFLFGRLS